MIMAMVTSSVFLDILLALLPLLYLVYWFFTNNDEYWDNRGVPNVSKGNVVKKLLGTHSPAENCLEMYNKFPNEKFAGFFEVKRPLLVVRDPELIQKVLIKDFVHFHDRGGFFPPSKDSLLMSLFGLRGQAWRDLRRKLTPTFTTGKLRMMLDQVSNGVNNLMDRMDTFIKEDKIFETKEFMYEFTLDVIAGCAFGLQFKPNSPEFITFRDTVKKMFNFSFTSIFKLTLIMASPKLADVISFKLFPKETSEYFINLTKDTLKYRKDNNIHRNDYLQLLITLKEQEDSGKNITAPMLDATEDDAVIDQMHYTEQNEVSSDLNKKLMTEEVISANSFSFLTAGSESTASMISFTLLNLARYPDVQQRVQQEVDLVLKQHGGWSYDAVKDLTYLDQVIQETQRINPLLAMLLRECVIPYKIPGSDVVIEKGVLVAIPVAGLHMDPQYYPEPDRFNPDRFEGNNFKPNSTYLPFGDGPRICIAMRFAVMEIKVCVARVMSQYTVKLNPKTKTPIRFKKRAFFPEVEGGIWLTFNRRKPTT